jgi:high-affinity iron transporter
MRDRRARLVVVLALGVLSAVPAPALAADAAKGRTVYETRCAPCHGSDGKGDGPAAAALTPPPRNFRDPAFWNGRTPAQLALTVKDGRPGTLMAPFKDVLSAAEIDDVVAYVQSFRPAAH